MVNQNAGQAANADDQTQTAGSTTTAKQGVMPEVKGLIATFRNAYRKASENGGRVRMTRVYTIDGPKAAIKAYIAAQGENLRRENDAPDGKPLYFTSIITPGANWKKLNLLITPNGNVVEDNIDAIMKLDIQQEMWIRQEQAKLEARKSYGFGFAGGENFDESLSDDDLNLPG